MGVVEGRACGWLGAFDDPALRVNGKLGIDFTSGRLVDHLHEALRHGPFLGERIDDHVNGHLHLAKLVLAFNRFSVSQAQTEVDADKTSLNEMPRCVLPCILVFVGTGPSGRSGGSALEFKIRAENGVVVRQALRPEVTAFYKSTIFFYRRI